MLCWTSSGGLRAAPVLHLVSQRQTLGTSGVASQQVAGELLVHMTMHGFADGRDS